jgi:hypothetical protein
MHNLNLFDPTGHAIPADDVRSAVESDGRFGSVRRNTPTGTLVEATFNCGDAFTTARLSEDGERISLSSTSAAAPSAALVLQRHLRTPLRIVDTANSFDLMLGGYASLEDLNAAIDEARAGRQEVWPAVARQQSCLGALDGTNIYGSSAPR